MTDESELITLAPEEVLLRYLLPLDPESLQKACRSFRAFSEVCRNEFFWKRKVEHDFGSIPKHDTWKKTWIKLITLHRVEITSEYSLGLHDIPNMNAFVVSDIEDVEDIPNRPLTKDEMGYLLTNTQEIVKTSNLLNGVFNLSDILVDYGRQHVIFVFDQNDESLAQKNFFTPGGLRDELIREISDVNNNDRFGTIPITPSDDEDRYIALGDLYVLEVKVMKGHSTEIMTMGNMNKQYYY